MSRLRWTLRATSIGLEIAQSVSRDTPEAARRWVAMLRKRARAAARMPRAGRRVPELGEILEAAWGQRSLRYRRPCCPGPRRQPHRQNGDDALSPAWIPCLTKLPGLGR